MRVRFQRVVKELAFNNSGFIFIWNKAKQANATVSLLEGGVAEWDVSRSWIHRLF